MPPKEDDFVRVHIRIPRKLYEDMQEVIPKGVRRHVIEIVLHLIIDAVRQGGMVVAGSILDRRFKLVRDDRDDK
jgi:hypothetical protein